MTFSPPFQRTFQPTFDRRNAGGAWWNLFGAIPLTNCVAAYQPKGAASQAASYVNLVTPGTYDAAPGTAPTWDTTNGWKFLFASSQYLTTGITPSNVQANNSAIVRFTGHATNDGCLFGTLTTSVTTRGYLIQPNRVIAGHAYENGDNATALIIAGDITSGVMGIANATGYLNGAAETGSIGGWTGASTLTIYIGAINFNGSMGANSTVNIQAIAFYNNNQSANMAALTTEINAL